MASKCVYLYVLLTSLLAVTSFAVKVTEEGRNIDNNVGDTKDKGQAKGSSPPASDVNDGLVDSDDEDGSGLDPESKIEGIPIKYLTTKEVYQIADKIDEIDEAIWDILAAKKFIFERSSQSFVNQSGRKERSLDSIGRLFLNAGRALFKDSNVGRLSSSGDRITRQYAKPGSYQDALHDFNRFNLDNVKTFNGAISGQTGTFGKYKFTVRDGSKHGGPPTLDVRSPQADGGTYVRKFRYKGDQ